MNNGERVGRAGHITTGGAHMPKPDKATKPNQGQDEKTHTFVNEASGETREATMREFRDSLRDQGFTKPEDAAEETPTEEVPAEETPA